MCFFFHLSVLMRMPPKKHCEGCFNFYHPSVFLCPFFQSDFPPPPAPSSPFPICLHGLLWSICHINRIKFRVYSLASCPQDNTTENYTCCWFWEEFFLYSYTPHPLVLRLLSSFQCLINMRKVSRNIIMGVFL